MKLSRRARKTIVLLILLLAIVFLKENEFRKLVYPIKYESVVLEYSEMYDVDPNLVMAIISVESKFKEDAVSNKGAIGLMQIMPDTGLWASEKIGLENFREEDLYDSDTNIQIGTWYISCLIDEFGGDVRNAIAAYNGGSGNVSAWLEDSSYSQDGEYLSEIPFPETREYVEKVIKAQGSYREIYGGRS